MKYGRRPPRVPHLAQIQAHHHPLATTLPMTVRIRVLQLATNPVTPPVQVPATPQAQVRVPHQATVLVPLQVEVQPMSRTKVHLHLRASFLARALALRRVPALACLRVTLQVTCQVLAPVLRQVQDPARLPAVLQVPRLVRAPVLHPAQVQVNNLATVRVKTPRIQVTRRRQGQATNQAHRLAAHQVLPRAHRPATLLVGARVVLQVTPPVIDHLCRLVRRRAIAQVIILLRVPRRLEVLSQQKLPVTNPVLVHRMLPVRHLTIRQVGLLLRILLLLRGHPRQKHQVRVRQILPALPQATSRVHLRAMSRVRHQVKLRARDLVLVRAPSQAHLQV